MKKYFFIATAALAALASCSKVTPVAEPDQAISFQVANYSSRTKANEVSITSEGFTQFITNAWFHQNENADGQRLMENERIEKGTTYAPNEWAPTTRPYYWPKTGYINFYSYASIKSFTGTPTAGEDKIVAEYAISQPIVTVNDEGKDAEPWADNVLVAAPALKQTKNDPQYASVGDHTNGVPTLFTHMLARVKFMVKLDASATESGYSWKAAIKDGNLLNVPAAGTMTVTYVDNTLGNGPVWVLPEDAAKKQLPAKAQTLEAVGGQAAKDAVALSDLFVVIPQNAKTNEFNLTYDLTCLYNNAEVYTETVPVKVTMDKFYGTAVPEGNLWNYNTVYTYTVTIKPGADPILMDPAIAPWGDPVTGEIVVPD